MDAADITEEVVAIQSPRLAQPTSIEDAKTWAAAELASRPDDDVVTLPATSLAELLRQAGMA
jgi:hypothetical protein